MLEIHQKERHLSIKSLEAPELPKLTVLTGVNGSGKSHLLSGIRDGKITAKISDVEIKSDEIRLISAPDFLNDAETHHEKVSGSQVDRFWNILQVAINHYCTNPAQSFLLENKNLSKNKYYKKYGVEFKENDKFIQITEEENGAIRRVEKHINALPIILHEDIEYYIESYSKKILHVIQTAEQIVRNNTYKPQNKQDITHVIAGLILANNDPIKKVHNTLDLISKIVDVPISLIQENQFRNHIPNEYQLNPFDRSFTSWFVEYREEFRINSARRDDHADDSSVSFLHIDEFEQRYGKKPWKEMDSILKVLGIDLSFVPPTSENLENYVAKLKNGTGDIISTKNISSGEKVILSLISSIKYSLSSDFLSNFPKLILLDEPDAHLHPKFASILIEMLQEITSQRDDLYCIMVTHSPTTVALANDSEIFYIKSNEGRKLLSSIDKETMLSVLTYGLPSLNISTNNARQIYVEGKDDKIIYHLIHDRYRDFCLHENLETPKTYLTFLYHGINSGIENKGGVSGCASVRSQVSALRSCGVDTIYGVVDWDLKKIEKLAMKFL